MSWSDVRAALAETDPQAKCLRVDRLWADVDSGAFVPSDPQSGASSDSVVTQVPDVGRPEQPVLVHPSELRRRSLGSVAGRVALIHAVAHIEFNAINLGLDAALRFRGMPDDFYRDWLSVAFDEARHFRLLTDRLEPLGARYGDLPAHNGLWDMAEKTSHDVLVRMALVPRVLEARGLDVTPGMIDKLRAVDDEATVDCLEIILAEEVRHVAIGSAWFRYCCDARGLEPERTFRGLLRDYFGGALRGPFNHSARREAGFSGAELDALEAMA